MRAGHRWEVDDYQGPRIRHHEGPFRIVYCFRPGGKIVLLHGFVKRSEQIPAQELDLALARKAKLP